MTGNRLFISDFRTLSALGYISSSGEKLRIHPKGAEYKCGFPVFSLHEECGPVLERYIRTDKTPPDRVTLLALAASSGACRSLALAPADTRIGISIGSSRGPTTSIEESHGLFVSQLSESEVGFARGRRHRNGPLEDSAHETSPQMPVTLGEAPSVLQPGVPAYTSPRTTAGTISSSIAQEILQIRGKEGLIIKEDSSSAILSLGTSMTCSSAFHSILIGVGMLRSGLVDKWIFGGAEAPLTPYTLAQMEALGIYTRYPLEAPCRPGILEEFGLGTDQTLKNSFTLGEGSGAGMLSLGASPPEGAIFEVVGIGWGIERTPSPTGISEDGDAFYAAMESALTGVERNSVYGVVAHAPGTVKGDRAELAAIRRIFGHSVPQHNLSERRSTSEGSTSKCKIPVLLSSKHVTGHTFGASGMLSLEFVRALALGAVLPGLPRTLHSEDLSGKRFLINSGGFGGNAVSLIVEWLGDKYLQFAR